MPEAIQLSTNSNSNLVVFGWIVFSIVSSTSLILLLKGVKPHLPNCQWTITLSTFHFISTWFALFILSSCGLIRKVSREIPIHKRILLASLVMMSIIFMNYNLTTNSIGFYQMSKLVCIPYMIIFNMIFKNQKYTAYELISLVVLLAGVGLFSVSDVELNRLGIFFAIIAVLSTVHNQMLTGSYQAEYSINGPELQLAIIPFETIFSFFSSIALEGKSFFGQPYLDMTTILLLAGTCFFAIGVNIATFGLIGKTSSVTYQVVGHLKTVLLLIFGYIFFPSKWDSKMQMIRAILGICTALAGVFLYTAARLDIQKKRFEESERKPLLADKGGSIDELVPADEEENNETFQ